ncbi:hypothetical protein K443DRAFT_673819 [Laccaria amethystina LaAM-08-1]|uniref:Glycine cleavage system H protein n=1 Tax=Laccaria amethystina LaAM-08-1 TaxID=1095629 RepID=A0A0C9YFU8_9AGAR|nr:hypothetical protein K443DRAFT_673819 [Laccaria amethystina LaAM-08-1]
MQSILKATTRSRHSSILLRQSSMSRVCARPQNLRTLVTKRYTIEHEAVAFDDSTGIGIVSITNHAQSSLGDVVFVELPALGTKVNKGDQIGAVESVKAASDIYAPVSGTIEEINEKLSSEPGLLNKSPEDKGWLCKIKLHDPSEVERLLTEEDYHTSYQS